jgi:hypothetical protein
MSDYTLLAHAVRYLEKNPPVTPPESVGESAALNPAVARCCAAYDKAHAESLVQKKGSSLAAKWAGQSAYCNAMPTFSSHQSVIDFISCVTHGLLIEAIPQDKVSKLLYAAQTAACVIPKPPRIKPSAAPKTIPPSLPVTTPDSAPVTAPISE